MTEMDSGEEMEALTMGESVPQKTTEVENIFTKEQILRREYEQREKAIMDYNSAMSAECRIGYSEGREETRRETAVTMLENHLPMEMISKCLGVSIEEVRRLLKRKI